MFANLVNNNLISCVLQLSTYSYIWENTLLESLDFQKLSLEMKRSYNYLAILSLLSGRFNISEHFGYNLKEFLIKSKKSFIYTFKFQQL